MKGSERFKLIYLDGDAWEHEWDIADTYEKMIIPQHGNSIVAMLNELNGELLTVKAENSHFKNSVKIYQRDDKFLMHENRLLKQALLEILEELGDKCKIDFFDKLFNLSYDYWSNSKSIEKYMDWDNIEGDEL